MDQMMWGEGMKKKEDVGEKLSCKGEILSERMNGEVEERDDHKKSTLS
jgi:hypothetical protein